MQRGELYRIRTSRRDPRATRVYLIVSRERFVDLTYSTLVCVPVYTNPTGADTEVHVGPEAGLKHASLLRCDEATSISRSSLTDYVGSLSPAKLREVNRALAIALDILPEDIEDL